MQPNPVSQSTRDSQRFCLLTSRLPVSVSVGGREYLIDTRAAVAIDCLIALQDPAIPDEVKPAYVCSRVIASVSKDFPTELINQGFKECEGYLNGPQEQLPTASQSKAPKKQIMDYIQDAEAIVASFWHAYGLNLEQTTNLHWWVFMALLKYLPSDTTFSRIVSLRAKRLPAKASLEDKNELRIAQDRVAIKDRRTPEQKQRDAQESINALDL